MVKINYKLGYFLEKFTRKIIFAFFLIKRKGHSFREFKDKQYHFFYYDFEFLGRIKVYHRGTIADRGVIEQILINKDYDFSEFIQAGWVTKAYHQILDSNKSPLIIDAGANIGLGSIYLKNKFPSSIVRSVEPASSNIKLLKLNVCNKAEIFHGAINSKNKEIELVDPGQGEWGYSTHSAKGGKNEKLERVRCYKFSDLNYGDSFPFILKVDIEGGEKNEFEDIDFIRNFALIIIELHDWLYPGEETSSSFLKFAAKVDFDIVHKNENIFLFNRRFVI